MGAEIVEMAVKSVTDGPVGWSAFIVGSVFAVKMMLPIITALKGGGPTQSGAVNYQQLGDHCAKQQAAIFNRLASGENKFDELREKIHGLELGLERIKTEIIEKINVKVGEIKKNIE